MKKKKERKIKIDYDLSKAKGARKFLRDLRMPDGTTIESVWLKDKTEVRLDTCSDEQAIVFASQIYEELYLKSHGSIYLEDTTIN